MTQDERQRALLGAEIDPQVAERLSQPVRLTVTGRQPPWRHQVAAIALADLLGRLFPRLQIVCHAAAVADAALPPGGDQLAGRLKEAARHGGLDIAVGSTTDPVVHIAVGNAPAADIYIDGSRWLSYLGDVPATALPDDNTLPIGPLAAACRGAAQVFQRVLGDLMPVHTPVSSSFWSALTYTAVPRDEIGPSLASVTLDALLMGAGSIGGASVYALARVPAMRGRFAICDPQVLEPRNARKALLARQWDIQAQRRKVDVAADELAHITPLTVERHIGTLAEWAAARPADQPLPPVLCAVDSVTARRELQDHLPLEVLNAACGDLDVTVSGHVTDQGPCVYCLHIERVLDKTASRKAILARETGIPERTVSEHLTKGTPLDGPMLRAIAHNRREPLDRLLPWLGRTLDDLFRDHILYGEARVRSDGGDTAVIAPFVTALAGVLLAGEALKRTSRPEVADFRLGPAGTLPIKYEESLVHRPDGGMLTPVQRWPGDACLCRSTRRLELLRSRYGSDGR
jgi:molybdopterin/thiamine biosynthesis adenylyltransferase